MKIIRDGQEFELTFDELIRAHEEYELDCMIENVNDILESGTRDIELSDEQIKEVAMFAVHNLGRNDGYMEAFWMSIECTIDDYIDKLPVAEEEDDE